ncbi:MAG: hypothetical protein A2622_08455 [Bdellovibrionales bacterium RIFCSPHIGHO2_01_FULL_40_29]|nr:MAG: hypothetical protein A2622_08455 [Bdellovibrionales bacterium RIFCSPHIGHO2_01_FULL_40_29]OFZ35523.1 MAG: hypothetical protein A3D17_07690 [Bdellovibrionales bacterium RIFCSPHIGHO2_02_FULL_40_15]
MIKLVIIGTFIWVAFTSCSKSSNDVDSKKQFQGCVPEDELLATGIIGGPRVQQNDSDANRVAMILSDEDGDATGICTATLISSRVLLTAAHCITATPDKIKVAFHTSLSCESGFNIANTQRVLKTVVHEDYQDKTTTTEVINDIALIFLEVDAPSSYPIFKIADPQMVRNSRIYFYGYGVTGSHNKDSGVLRKTSLQRSDYVIKKDIEKVRVDQSNGKGICYGDSGGPAFVLIDNEPQILGVNSFGRGNEDKICEGTSTLALVFSYKKWIQDVMNENSNFY